MNPDTAPSEVQPAPDSGAVVDLLTPLSLDDHIQVTVIGDAAALLATALAGSGRRTVTPDPAVDGGGQADRHDLVFATVSRPEELAYILGAADELLSRDGAVLVALDARANQAAGIDAHAELKRLRTHLVEAGFDAQRSYTNFYEPGRPSVTVADTFLQTEAFTPAFSWLIGRALGDAPPSRLNSIRTVVAARSREALGAALRDGYAWTTESVEATPQWRLTRQFRLGETGWELRPLTHSGTVVSGPFQATNTGSTIPPGHNGEHLLTHMLVASGLDDPEAQGALRGWARAARSVVGGDARAIRPIDVLPRNFVVGDDGWHFVDNGLTVRFPYPAEVLILRAIVGLLVERVRPLGAPESPGAGTVRDIADRLMRITGGSASDLLIELWLQFEADLETRTSAHPRSWDVILRERSLLLELTVGGLPSAEAVAPDLVHGPAPVGIGRSRARRGRAAAVHRLRWLVGNPLFDAAWYRDRYEDVRERRANAYRHFRRHGWREGRDPNPIFDTDWYLARYPDVGSAGVNPLDHYLDFGAHEGRDPGPSFDGQAYLDRHPDVRAAGLNPLLHYLRRGSVEARAITAVAGEERRSAKTAMAPDEFTAPLERTLESEYQIRPARIRKRHGGEGSTGYEVLDTEGARWFVKVSSPDDPCWDVPDRRQALLASQDLSPVVRSGRIVAPRLTASDLPVVTLAGRDLAVFPYVEAHDIGVCASWSDAAMTDVAAFVGDMHRASLPLRPESVVNRWPPDYSRLEALLARLQDLGRDASALQRRAAAMVEPHHDELVRLAREFGTLRTKVAEMSFDLVLCHTDLNPANLLRDDGGRLVLIDCEDFTWAPAESDLYFLVDPRRVPLAVEAYRAARGPCRLQPEPLELAYYTDYVGLFYLIVCRLLAGQHSPAEGARYLADLQRGIVSYLDGRFHDLLGPAMDAIREASADQ